MPERRTFLGTAGGIVGTALFGLGAASSTDEHGGDDEHGHDHGSGGSADEAVTYVRNVEEVKGHLISSANLLAEGRQEDATLHANHGSDYFGAVLTRLRDENPELATRLRARLNKVPQRVGSESAETYRSYVTNDVYPLLDDAINAVVDSETREPVTFDVRVMNALAGRIADEYSAAVNENGKIVLSGEYWDGRGFLTRIEQRNQRVSATIDGAGADSLDSLRSQMEAVELPATVQRTTLSFRIETAAAAELPSATVEGRGDAVSYVRSAEEVKGHLTSSVTLAEYGSTDAGLHAGHGSDYLLTLLTPVQQVDSELATTLFDRIRAASDRVESDSAAEFEQYVTGEVFPLVDEAVTTAVPSEFTDSPSFSAAVFLSLGDRVAEEYDAAVNDDEVIELYGEYWDARGFFNRMEARYPGFEEDLDSETQSNVSEELDILSGELETARPDWDVGNSVAALHRFLDGFAAVEDEDDEM